MGIKTFRKQFGASVSPELIDRYNQSENWKNGKFENLAETTMDISLKTIPSLLYKQIFEKNGRYPQEPISVTPFDKETFLAPSDTARMIWYGHSVVLMRINGKTILIDPMLGPNASPIAPFPTKRFSTNTLDFIDSFPPIDLMLMTHDHYDHLDLASISLLKDKVANYFVAIGAGRHLEKWGVAKSKIKEFDWWDQAQFDDIEITFTPTRHFSGRGLSDRAKSLWGGWVFKTSNENIYFSGDGGYGEHFKEVGSRLGPFDFGFMECGQYNENWHLIHMYPEETVQATIDAGVKKSMAVHWAGFALALHHWKDPIERFSASADLHGLSHFSPPLGRVFSCTDDFPSRWWETLE